MQLAEIIAYSRSEAACVCACVNQIAQVVAATHRDV